MGVELVIGEAFDIAVGELLSVSVQRVMAKRTKEVRNAIVEDIRTARLDLHQLASKDENVSMMIALVDALRQGAAVRNLRIIARILAYKAGRQGESTDDFLSWVDIIKGLTEKELCFLLALWRSFEEDPDEADADRYPAKSARAKAYAKIVGPGRLLEDSQEYEVFGYSLLKTGLVAMVSVMAEFNMFRPTAKLSKLVRMAELNEWAESELGIGAVP